MGYTEQMATFFKNGKVDKKAECDAILTHSTYSVVKSVMVGNTYYGAILDSGDNSVFAVTVKTYVTKENGFSYFGYKIIEEFCGPVDRKCPMSIINLLTDTDSEWANEWRQDCIKYNTDKTDSKKNANKLPVGTKIKVVLDGEEVILIKSPARYQFKTPFWYNARTHQYVKKATVNSVGFEIVA